MSLSKTDSPELQLGHPGGESQQDKRDRIIERAIIMFNGLGYDRVRVSDITDSLSMGKGTFYLYFRDKKALLLNCFDHVGGLIDQFELLPGIREGDFFSKVGPRVENIGHNDWFPGLVNLLRVAALSADEDVKTKARAAYEIIAGHLRHDLQEAICAGRARDVNVDLAAYAFIGMADNLWFRSRLDEAYRPEEIVQFAVDATAHLFGLEGSPEIEAGPTLEKSVRLISRDGVAFDLHAVRYNGEARLSATLGEARIEVDPSRVTDMSLADDGGKCRVTLLGVDGSETEVGVNGSTEVSGAAALGTVSIALRDVSTISPR